MSIHQDIATIPNLLTVGRLLSLPVTVLLFRNEHYWAAACVFLGAMATDCIDGWLAKRLNQQTALGLYLDPVVDKIVLLSLFYELAHAGLIDWAVPHLFLARELLQNALRSVAALRGAVVGANWMGKTKAWLQTVLIGWGLIVPALPTVLSETACSRTAIALRAAAWIVVLLAWCFLAVFVSWNHPSRASPRDRGTTEHSGPD